jgi:hypothetical protein
MEDENSNPHEVMLTDTWVRGFIGSAVLGLLFGPFAIAGSFRGVVKFNLVLWPLFSVLHYFIQYRYLLRKRMEVEHKPYEVAKREVDRYLNRVVVEILFLMPTASISGAALFYWGYPNIPLAVTLVILNSILMGYLHARVLTPVRFDTKIMRISRFLARHID